MKAAELREKYLAFFEEKLHKRVPSSSLIPDDPSMLLTSAGMVQFKPYFLGQKHLESPYIGTTTVQKCVRTTDIDNIGHTGRHQSFFEMLGNFSFGGYFKKEMCAWAYEFSTEVLGFDPKRIYFTIYLDDEETHDIWRSIGVPENHISRLGADDNFWMAGPTGPCGPCSELYYDQGEEFGCGSPDCAPGCDCDRFLEFWNLVFTQFDRQEDGTLLPLPQKNIDTGMGLERTTAILQGVQSNYETDILQDFIKVGERLSHTTYGSDAKTDLSLRIIADHARAITFLIADGILPANEGRGYVLRRLLRRAVRHGHLIGIEGLFLSEYVDAIVSEMGGIYPEIVENRALIERVVVSEEERFGATLRQGQSYLDEALATMNSGDVLAGSTAFVLHDTYGFPIELTCEICAEQGFTVDLEGFTVEMEEQRSRARAAAKDDAWGTYGGIFSELANSCGQTDFLGYSSNVTEAKVLALVVDGARVTSAAAGTQVDIILDKTPFYGEMGGQVGDTGSMTGEGDVSIRITDTQIPEKGLFAHKGVVENGTVHEGDTLTAAIDVLRRERIRRNHTATHILHWALRKVLGDHVKQAGSFVGPDRLRFDFTHFEALTAAQLAQVENLANEKIMGDEAVFAYETSLVTARESGVTALFGEKYGEFVRVLECGSFSKELCGGTHVGHTSEIGLCKIVSEGSVGANMRRIEAVTSFDALALVNAALEQLDQTAATLRVPSREVAERVVLLASRARELEDELASLKKEASASAFSELLADSHDVGYPVVIAHVGCTDAQSLRDAWDIIGARLPRPGAVVLAATSPEGAPLLMAAGSKDAIALGFDAGAIIKHIAPAVRGGGGGKPSMAQAGGKDASGIEEALRLAREMLGVS